ncbi:hypothetical protein STSO111631_20545 [Stackebrandtia soli]
MPIGTAGRGRLPSRRASACAPSLLKPIRLMSACDSGRRYRRGRGLPGCARHVTVPISMKPKPSAGHASIATPFLSMPAASPTVFGKSIPKTRAGSLTALTLLMAFRSQGFCATEDSMARVFSWAASGSPRPMR